jgi:nicotinamidase-related amidase
MGSAMDPNTTALTLVGDQNDDLAQDGILNSIRESGAFTVGGARAEAIPELLAFGDRVMHITGKVGFTACSNTALEGVLAERGTLEVLIAGMVTSLCIDSTCRAADERGDHLTILSDCTSARTPGEQDFDCRNISPLCGAVARSYEIARDDVAVAA